MVDYPDVPDYPGVPPLLRDPTQLLLTSVPVLVADAVGVLSRFGQTGWGLFLGGAPVIVADTVLAFDYKQTWIISDFPVERGAFESYDKVQTPFQVTLRFVTGGSDQDRTAFLASIAAVAGTLNLFDAVTPEKTYRSVNVASYEYRRVPQSVGLIQVDVRCEEIRVTTSGAFSDTKSPSGVDQENGGTVQPVDGTRDNGASLTPSTGQGSFSGDPNTSQPDRVGTVTFGFANGTTYTGTAQIGQEQTVVVPYASGAPIPGSTAIVVPEGFH